MPLGVNKSKPVNVPPRHEVQSVKQNSGPRTHAPPAGSPQSDAKPSDMPCDIGSLGLAQTEDARPSAEKPTYTQPDLEPQMDTAPQPATPDVTSEPVPQAVEPLYPVWHPMSSPCFPYNTKGALSDEFSSKNILSNHKKPGKGGSSTPHSSLTRMTRN